MKLRMLEGTYGVARLDADAVLPDWFEGSGLSAMVRAEDELTLVCRQDRIPPTVTAQRDWACLRSVGPFAFDQAGVLVSLVAPVSDAGIGVFVLCTFDGEHLLFPADAKAHVREVLIAAGHGFDG